MNETRNKLIVANNNNIVFDRKRASIKGMERDRKGAEPSVKDINQQLLVMMITIFHFVYDLEHRTVVTNALTRVAYRMHLTSIHCRLLLN